MTTAAGRVKERYAGHNDAAGGSTVAMVGQSSRSALCKMSAAAGSERARAGVINCLNRDKEYHNCPHG